MCAPPNAHAASRNLPTFRSRPFRRAPEDRLDQLRRYSPVVRALDRATLSGGPLATTWPALLAALGANVDEAVRGLITSRVCSINKKDVEIGQRAAASK